MATAKVKLSTSISRSYGAITTTWGMEIEAQVSNRSDIIREYARMHEHIRAEMIDYESATLPKLPTPSQVQPQEGLPEANHTRPVAEWMPLKAIFREVKKGKAFFYAQTSMGRFMRHGAPLYWDNCKGFSLKAFEEQAVGETVEFDPDQIKVLIREKQGKFYAIAVAHKDTIGE